MKNEYSFLSTDNETMIHITEWVPDQEVVGILVIAHGITEHMGRYEDFARHFNTLGFVVAGHDQIGHGLSGEKQMCIPEGGWEYLVENLRQCVQIEAKHHPKVPVYLLGFSLGSFVVRDYLSHYGDFQNPKVDGAILIGTGMQSVLALKLAQMMVKNEIQKHGRDGFSDFMDDLAFGNYNKKFQPNKTSFNWLCANESTLQDYLNDPLAAEHITPGYFSEMLSGMIRTHKIKALDLPILALSGQDDPVGEFGKGVHKYVSALRKAGIQAEEKLYPCMRHDILHEEWKDSVYLDIENWLAGEVSHWENNSLIQESYINGVWNKEDESLL